MRIIQEGYHYQSRKEETAATSLSTILARLTVFFLSAEPFRYILYMRAIVNQSRNRFIKFDVN